MEKIRGLKIYSEKIRGLKILGLSEENTPGGYSLLKMSTPQGNVRQIIRSLANVAKLFFQSQGNVHHIIHLLTTMVKLFFQSLGNVHQIIRLLTTGKTFFFRAKEMPTKLSVCLQLW